MNRRKFLKHAGVLAVAAASSRSSILWGGFGGFYSPKSPVSDKIPFEDKETLESIRAKIAYNGYSFTVDRNFPYDECGYPGTPPYPTLPKSEIPTYAPYSDIILGGVQSLPSSFDIRNINGHSYIGPILNQKSTYMCWAFGACDAASAAYNLKNGLFDDNCVILSPLYLRWVSIRGFDPGLKALYALTKSGDPNSTPTGLEGACREIDFPFASYPESIANNRPPDFLIEKAKQAPRITLKRCAMVYPADYRDTTAQIKAAIYRYGAVRVGVRQHSAAFLAYKSGVYEDTFTEPDADPYYKSGTGHSVSLVGWDDNPPEGGGGCWILRNEWGTSWGENGYMRIRYFSAHINCSAEFIEASSPDEGELAIRGNVTVAGQDFDKTTVTLTGDDTFAVVPNGGKYAFQTLKAGRYVVTPTQPGVIFSPSSREVVLSGQDVTGIDFTGNMFL